MLIKDKSFSVQQKNLGLLATEKFKSETEVLSELMNDIFHSVERPYNLRSNYTLEGRGITLFITAQRVFVPLPPIKGSSPKFHETFCVSRKEFITWTAEHFLAEYVRNILGE